MTDHEIFFHQLKRDVDADHQRIDGAAAPPANMWNSIRAQVMHVEKKEETKMITSNAQTQHFAPIASPDYETRSKARHTLSLAASFLLVMSIALGGWFATMQLNQPSDPEPRLAILGSTPAAEATPEKQGGTCDVEPLTTDQVMAVVRNPFLYMENGPAGDPVEPDISTSPYRADLYEASPSEQIVMFADGTRTPTDQEFEAAGAVADGFLNCLAFGTLGQAWVFLSPIHIQMDVLWEFPVFADENDVRARVEERLDQPALTGTDPLVIPGAFSHFDPAEVMINPEPELAIVRRFILVGVYDSAVTFGVRFLDETGKEVYLSAGNGRDLVGAPAQGSFHLTVTVAYSSVFDSWFVVPYIQI